MLTEDIYDTLNIKKRSCFIKEICAYTLCFASSISLYVKCKEGLKLA